MMIKFLFAAFLFLAGMSPAFAYDPGAFTTSGAGAPTGVCTTNGQEYTDTLTANSWNCAAGTWSQSSRAFTQPMQVGNQVGINYSAYTKVVTGCTTTSGSSALTCGNLYFILSGTTVTDSGNCIPANTTVNINNGGSTTGVLSNNASGTCSNDTVTAYYNWTEQLLPLVNETGQTIADPVVCFAGGNGNGGSSTVDLEFNPNNQLIQASYMTSPFGQASAVPLVFPAGQTGTIIPGDVQSGCGYAAGTEVAAGATMWLEVLAQVPTIPSTQVLSTNRTGASTSGWVASVGGGNVPSSVTAFSPALTANTTASAVSGATTAFLPVIPSYLAASPTSFYISTTASTYNAYFPTGAKVSSVNTGTGGVTFTGALTGTVPSGTTLQFTQYQPSVFASTAPSIGASTVTLATACPVGVGPGFFVSGTGIPGQDIVVSCSAGVLTIASPFIATGSTTVPIMFTAFNNYSTLSFNPALIKANLQQRVLSFLNAGDSETGVAGGNYVTTTTTASFNPTSCVSNTATLSVNQTNGSGQNLIAATGPVGLYIANSPFVLSPVASGTLLTSFSPSASTITITPCPLYTVPSGTALTWGTASSTPYNDIGWFEAGVQGHPATSLARSGDSYTLWVNDRAMRTKVAGMTGYTHFVSLMCDNDIGVGGGYAATLPGFEALYQNIWTAMKLRGMKPYQATCVPRSTGTYTSEPAFSTPTVTAAGTGYPTTGTFTLTAAGGTLAPSPLNLPTQFTCTANGSGGVASCVVASTGGAGAGTPAIGYYTAAPTIANNALTGSTGSGVTVTLGTYATYQDPYAQTSNGANFAPTVSTTVNGAVTASTTVTVSSLTNSGSPALPGTIATGMYISTLSGAPANTIITGISGNVLTLNNAVTFANGAAINVVSLRTEFNDWIRTTPAPLAGYIDVAAQIEYGSDSDLWASGMTADGQHAGTSVGNVTLAAWMYGLVNNGTTFTLP